MMVKGRICKLILSLFFISLGYTAFSQGKQDIAGKALEYFKAKNYGEALKSYERLLRNYPKDPMYNYYCGVCLVITNQDPAFAFECLNYAIAKETPRDVFFYLATNYFRQYQFEDAFSNCSKFLETGTRSDIDNLQAERFTEIIANGKGLTKQSRKISIFENQETSASALLKAYQDKNLPGKFENISLTSRLFAQWQQGVVAFVPQNIKEGEYIYYSAPSRNKKNNRDIFRSKKTGEGKWSEPEALGIPVNSLYDEDFPFYDKASSILYYSSKGFNGMGGFDIFKSTFDSAKNTWSYPVNIGFPMNSPCDDILFTIDRENNHCYFSTNRMKTDDLYSIITSSLFWNDEYSPLDGASQMLTASFLKVNAEKFDNQRNDKKDSKQIDPGFDSQTEYSTENYDLQINQALNFQVKTDSCLRLVDEKKETLATVQKEEEKNKLKSEILDLQNKSVLFQREADKRYESARKMEEDLSSKLTTVVNQQNDEKKEEDKHVKARYSVNKENPDTTKVLALYVGYKEKTTVTENKINTDFCILNKSPYSESKPFPVNEHLSSGIIYRIQLGAFSKTLPYDYFKGIKPIFAEFIDNGSVRVTKYFAGLFQKYNESENALAQVRNLGFRDAYLVAYYDGSKIPIDKARELEKEQ
jgi:hypothetical protein